MEKETAADARAYLLTFLKPNTRIYTALKNVSRSGFYRHIACYIVYKNEIRDISYYVARACGFTYKTKTNAIGIYGTGMDMGFHIVYQLGDTLWPEGTKKAHGTRNGEPDSEGGYALKQSWI